MNQFYVEPGHLHGDEFHLSEEESRHAVASLRIRPGEILHATDGLGTRYSGSVITAGPRQVSVRITQRESISAPHPAVHVILGALKSRERLEFAVEKCAELGVASIVVCAMDHCERQKVRVDRLQSICVSALKQSLGAHLCRVEEAPSLLQALDRPEFSKAVVLMADETVDSEETLNSAASPSAASFAAVTPTGASTAASSTTARPDGAPEDLVWLIGPEGGFSEKERGMIAAIRDRRLLKVSLGSNRLRAETAAIVAVARTGQVLGLE